LANQRPRGVLIGRDNKPPIAIRAGGHNGPGLASVDDGLVIDLSTMKGVRVDPAMATVGGGRRLPYGRRRPRNARLRIGGAGRRRVTTGSDAFRAGMAIRTDNTGSPPIASSKPTSGARMEGRRRERRDA